MKQQQQQTISIINAPTVSVGRAAARMKFNIHKISTRNTIKESINQYYCCRKWTNSNSNQIEELVHRGKSDARLALQ